MLNLPIVSLLEPNIASRQRNDVILSRKILVSNIIEIVSGGLYMGISRTWNVVNANKIFLDSSGIPIRTKHQK